MTAVGAASTCAFATDRTVSATRGSGDRHACHANAPSGLVRDASGLRSHELRARFVPAFAGDLAHWMMRSRAAFRSRRANLIRPQAGHRRSPWQAMLLR